MLVCLGVAVIAADQICNFFKHYTPKLRPSHTPAIEQFVHTLHGYRGGLYGTVSAHAAVSFTIAMFSARLFSRSWYTWTIMLWAALVCYSRIYAGLHYPMDILFGTTLGLLLGAAAYRTYRKATAPRPEKGDGNAPAASRETPKSLNDPNA
jgi:undecaprenyl-diphosphatase